MAPLRDREGALTEVPVVGPVREVVEPLATPPEQIVRAQQDPPRAGVAAGTTAGAVQGLAGLRIDGGFHGSGQLGIEGNTCHIRVVDREGGLVNLAGGADQC